MGEPTRIRTRRDESAIPTTSCWRPPGRCSWPQTLDSIGYGVLHPASLMVNLLVCAESLVGLLFIALTTDLAFARFSCTVARIRFSTTATVHLYDGVPTLLFRLANEGRNAIVEAR